MNLTVGKGGLGKQQALASENDSLQAQPGESSKIAWKGHAIQAFGGGAGGYAFARDCKGGDGSSGGGGSSLGPSSFGSGGLGIPGQGNAGAQSSSSAGGGGGGAGRLGGSDNHSTYGGDGQQRISSGMQSGTAAVGADRAVAVGSQPVAEEVEEKSLGHRPLAILLKRIEYQTLVVAVVGEMPVR